LAQAALAQQGLAQQAMAAQLALLAQVSQPLATKPGEEQL
jgi:hypothetical protein